MELGIIKPINIDVEMQASYLDYAMSVIVARALPDVRDGLKPVHRRILYAMHDLGLSPDKPYKKSARIVGEVLGKYHPHGDAAVYEAMVRMAQDFSLRYPLVDGQGNFGSIDGDNAAAMRYTEARLAKIATEMLFDIEKDTVDWTDNFDGTLKEPSVLPSALPNLLINGSSGIAVGMSTSIPPHNLGEVVDALCHLIDNYDCREDVTVDDLLKFIPGPDFPTGGIVYRYSAENGEDGTPEDVIAKAYASGRGSIVMQAKAHIEEMSRNRSRIIVTELPYQANKTNLIERIAELAREGRIEGITDLRDESDRTGMRVIIEMTRTVEPMKVLGDLYRLTPLQQTFGVSLLALVDDEPKLLSLKYMLLHFVEHRQQVIVRRSKHDLAKAKQRAHILEGLLKALDILDEVIALIRASRTADVARDGLKKQFGFTEIQAQAILDMQLRRLAALERKKLQDEYKEVTALIKELEALLSSPKKVLALIRSNLLDLKARYGDARRTQIADRAKGVLTTHDVLPEQAVTVALRADGTLVSVPGGDASTLKGGSERALVQALTANTRDELYLFSAGGRVTRIGMHQVPEGGAHHANLGGLRRGDRIAAMLALPKVNGEALEGNLVLATRQGQVKRASVDELARAAHGDPDVIRLGEMDEVVWAGVSAGGGEIMMFTAAGMAIRFKEDEVRPQGLPAGGMRGIKLGAGDRVVAACVVPPDADALSIATLTTKGWGKRSSLSEYPVKGRDGQGQQAAKLNPKTGVVAGALLVGSAGSVAAVLGGGIKSLPISSFPATARASAGKLLVTPVGGDTVERLISLPSGDGSGRPAKRGVEEPPIAKVTARAKRATTERVTSGKPKAAAVATRSSTRTSPKVAAKPENKPKRLGSAPQKVEPAAAPEDKKRTPTIDIPNLFGPLPTKTPAASSEGPGDAPAKTGSRPRARATPEAGSINRPPAAGQLSFSDDDEPPKRGRTKRG